MSKPPVAVGNVTNRSPWAVSVRSRPDLNRSFSVGRRVDAARYCAELCAAGHRAQLAQLETAFQLRVRRKGMAPQFITFDTPEQAEQARLHIEASLSVSIVRDYASAARWTLRALMQRYLVEVVPGHKGADIETNRLQRLMRDEPFVDKKLAALATVDLQDFIADRLADVAPATVDRDLDLISQVLRYADDVTQVSGRVRHKPDDLNYFNRPVRTRMLGGVGRARSHPTAPDHDCGNSGRGCGSWSGSLFPGDRVSTAFGDPPCCMRIASTA